MISDRDGQGAGLNRIEILAQKSRGYRRARSLVPGGAGCQNALNGRRTRAMLATAHIRLQVRLGKIMAGRFMAKQLGE